MIWVCVLWLVFLVAVFVLTSPDQPVPVEPEKIAILKYCSAAITFAILVYGSHVFADSPYRRIPQCVVGYVSALLFVVVAQVALAILR